MSAEGLIIILIAIGCLAAGFSAGAIWQSLQSTQPDPDYDPANWSDVQ